MFFFSSRRRHTRSKRDWSSDVCSSDLRDFEDRGGDPQLGVPVEGNGRPALLDVAHGLLWRAEHRPTELRAYLLDAQPDSALLQRSEERRVGKEGSSRWGPSQEKQKNGE